MSLSSIAADAEERKEVYTTVDLVIDIRLLLES